MQVETHLRRQKLKAEDMAVVKEWRKRQKRGSNDTNEFPEELLDPKNQKRRELLESAGPVQVKGLTKGKKRLAKDAKYGSGGAKRFKKANDAESAADMGGFSRKRNSMGPRGGTPQRTSFGGGSGGGGGGGGGSGGFQKTAQRKTGGGFGNRPKKMATRRPGKDSRRAGGT